MKGELTGNSMVARVRRRMGGGESAGRGSRLGEADDRLLGGVGGHTLEGAVIGLPAVALLLFSVAHLLLLLLPSPFSVTLSQR